MGSHLGNMLGGSFLEKLSPVRPQLLRKCRFFPCKRGVVRVLGGFSHRLTGIADLGGTVGAWDYLEFWINGRSTLVLVVCLALALGSSYVMLERISTFVLGGIVVCVGALVFALGPDLTQLISGLLFPREPVYPDWLLERSKYTSEFQCRSPWLEVSLYLTAVGGGAYDYIGYIWDVTQKEMGDRRASCRGSRRVGCCRFRQCRLGPFDGFACSTVATGAAV